MRARHEYAWLEIGQDHLATTYHFDAAEDYYSAHSELGPADITRTGYVAWYLGDEIVLMRRTTPELWEKYGDPQIRNANQTP